ncbi:MAG: tagaturonate epimerase family protein [bacterium]
MTNKQLIQKLTSNLNEANQVFPLDLSLEETVNVYPKSINKINGDFLFIARKGIDKYLYIILLDGNKSTIEKFQGEILQNTWFEATTFVKQCRLTHRNSLIIRQLFDFTRPVLIGLQNSIGLGDRLGVANPGHIRAIAGTNLKPILAQQSIRELQRTQRKPEEVLDAATWAVFQEGFKNGFGADADHLKTPEDIDLMVNAGFTMFTIDPSQYVVNESSQLYLHELQSRAEELPWELLNDSFENVMARYENKSYSITIDYRIRASREEVMRALVKYGGVIAHTNKMYQHLKEKYPTYPFELELSVDETDSPTTSFEHFFVVNELKRRSISLISFAPRFVGDFEKGIDYKGNLEKFKEEYLKHVKISELLGPYKISFHSGSDKFSIYEAVGELGQGYIHIKTAGTSYLEALRTLADKKPDLFREILDFARDQFEIEKATYHVSAAIENVLSSDNFTDNQLLELFDQNDARQVLHVTFGKVLTFKDENGKYLFRDRILNSLKEHEEIYNDYLQNHFRRHIKPFI